MRFHAEPLNLILRHLQSALAQGAAQVHVEVPASPNRMRWSPLPRPTEPTDFVEGLVTMAGNGSAAHGAGIGIHQYLANRSMVDTVFYDADGELLLVPQRGRLRLFTELGPLGSNGLANARDFLTPVAAFEDVERPTRVIQKFQGRLWSTEQDHSPLDVVAWHGNLAPYKYDLARFNTIGTVSFDHPDPSIFTVLTSPSDTPGTANCDFVIFPPRWMVGEDTFRPPWFHRNVMNEFMGLVHGAYDAKAEGFAPGGASLHNCMSGHGPDRETYERDSTAELKPHKIQDTLAFMFESRSVIVPTRFAMETPAMQLDYDDCWARFEKARLPTR